MDKLELGLTDRLVCGQYDDRRVGLREVIVRGPRVAGVHRADPWCVYQAHPGSQEG